MDRRWIGLDFRNCEPWWATSIRGWLLRVKQIQEGYGACGEVFMAFLRGTLDRGEPYPVAPVTKAVRGTTVYRQILPKYGPGAIYQMYEDFTETMERQSKQNR